MYLAQVNVLAVVGAAIASMLVGFVWYHPRVFGNYWVKLTGQKMSFGKAQTGYVLALVSVLVMAWVLAELLKLSFAVTYGDALKVGFLAWLGFSATTGLANAVFSGKSRNLFIFEQAHHLVVILVMAVILQTYP